MANPSDQTSSSIPPWHVADSTTTEPEIKTPLPVLEEPVPVKEQPEPELPPLPKVPGMGEPVSIPKSPPPIPEVPEPVSSPVPPITNLPKPEEIPLPPPSAPPFGIEGVMGLSGTQTPPVTSFKKEKKKSSAGKTILVVFLFLVLSVGGVLGYFAIQQGGLPFNLGRKAANAPCTCPDQSKCDIKGGCNPACCAVSSNCPSGQTCDIPNGYCVSGLACNDKGGGFHKACVDQKCVNVPGIGTNTCGSDSECVSAPPSQPTCTISLSKEGADGICIKADGAQVKVKACLNAANCVGGTRSITYRRTVANCSGTSCAGTCGNAGEIRTLTVPQGQLCTEETVGCSVTNKCGNCQVDVDNYGERAWQDSGCTTPTTPPAPSAPSCSGLTLDRSTITLGQTVNITANVSNFGLIKYGLCSSGNDCRVVDTQNPVTLGSGNSPLSKSFTPTAVGKYVFEVNAYDSSTCNSFCSPGSTWYKNTLAGGGGCDTANHWTASGSCTSSGCIKYLTVTQAPVLPVCARITVTSGEQSNLSQIHPGDTITVTVNATGLAEDLAVRIKKDGVLVKEVIKSQLASSDSTSDVFSTEYVIPDSGAGNYEVQGFIKSGGVWK